MAEVAAAITTIGVLLCVAIGAVAMRRRRDAEAGQRDDLVVDHQFLRQAARLVGHAAVVLDDDLDRLAAGLLAVLRHPQLDGGVDLAAGAGLLAGHRQDDADLHGVTLGQCGRRGHGGADHCEHLSALHHGLSPV
jgi:hypothetical protein